MLSKAKVKYIHSLELKKFRNEYNAFVAEGEKNVSELLPAFECELLVATKEWIQEHPGIHAKEVLAAETEEIRKISFLKTPQKVVAILSKKEYKLTSINPEKNLVLALDGIQDPGNLGTIIRLADWFGMEHIVCSKDTADVFNPKVVQATMGALAHVKVCYTDLETYLTACRKQSIPVYGTFLDGENMYDRTISSRGVIVMGNEGNGIRPEIEALVSEKLYIPNYPPERETAESLNVAIATAVVCAEFRRREGMKPDLK